MDGLLSLPAGGVEDGEDLVSAAVREAREEVGVTLRSGQLRLVHTLHARTRGEAWTGHFFLADTWEGTPTVGEPDKHADLRWVPLEAIPDDFVPYVRVALTALCQGSAYSAYGWTDAPAAVP